MVGLKVPTRIHIIPLGYEEDRIVEPAVRYDADKALFLEPGADSPDIEQPEYHDRVRERIQAAGIETETVECNIFNLYASLGTIAELANDFREHHVYVNLASGSKVTAIGGMIACMATGATPYYVRAENYAGGNQEPVASGVRSIEELPEYHIEEPEPQHISVLNYLSDHDSVTKRDLIDFGKRESLPFIDRYDTDNVQNPDRGYYRRLNDQIINQLESRGFVEVEKHSRYQYVSLSDDGANQLRAFRYLL